MIDGFNGAILIDDPRDWFAGDTTELTIQKNYNTGTFELNQLEYSTEYGRNLCTAYAPMGMLSDLTGRILSPDERKEIAKARTVMPDFDPAIGGYLVEGNNCVRKWWNAKHPEDAIRQVSIESGGEKFMEALKKGYRINFGYRGNSSYNEDKADGVLDGTTWGNTTYGHSTTAKFNGKHVVVDNYAGTVANVYEVKDFIAFMKGGNVFPKSYLFLKLNTMTESQVKRLEAKSLGIWNGEREGEPVTRGECAEMIMNFANTLKK